MQAARVACLCLVARRFQRATHNASTAQVGLAGAAKRAASAQALCLGTPARCLPSQSGPFVPSEGWAELPGAAVWPGAVPQLPQQVPTPENAGARCRPW